jgi:hypothetical protein
MLGERLVRKMLYHYFITQVFSYRGRRMVDSHFALIYAYKENSCVKHKSAIGMQFGLNQIPIFSFISILILFSLCYFSFKIKNKKQYLF